MSLPDPELAAAMERREAAFLSFGEEDWLAGTPMDPSAVPADPLPAMPGYPHLPASGGACALIVSPTGAGKSEFLQICAYDGAREGIRTAYLGHEVSEHEFNARSAKFAERRGDPIDQALREQLANVRYLVLTETMQHAWAHSDEWVAGIVDRYDVLDIDPLSAVESAIGLNFEQSNHDYATFHDRIVQPLVAKGVNVNLADNIGHAIEAKARAKGASAKQDRADLTFSCSPIVSPPGLLIKAGKVRSTRAPHRRGDEWLVHRDTRRIEKRITGSDEAGKSWQPTVLMERVSKELERESPLGKAAIRRLVTGRNEHIDKAIAELEIEGYIEHGSDGYRSRKPFRNPEGCPEDAPSELPTLPTLPQGAPSDAPSPAGRVAPVAFNKGNGATPDRDLEHAEELRPRPGESYDEWDARVVTEFGGES